MVKDPSEDNRRNPERTVYKRDGSPLPEGMIQKLKDAVWAGLAQKIQMDKAALCSEKGHQWIEGPENRMFCKRCGIQKETEE